MEEIAFGELGIRPWEYARMTYRELMLSISGLRARDKMLESWIRRATFIISATNFGGKEVSRKFERFWPDGENGPAKISERVKEQVRRINESDAMKRAKQKVKDGRT